jgi:aerobic carbon-monoxide dehydrogenase large subunit
MTTAEVGRARLRKEDGRLLSGRTKWTENIAVPGMLHMAILRSPFAHAKVLRVDVTGALEMPNVVTAFSGADVADTQGVLACAWPVTEDIVLPTYTPLAVTEVRHVGEPVAVVIARDRASAVDALEAIEVDYESLPVVLDLEGALAEGADLVHSDKGTNKCYTWIFDSAAAGSGTDVAAAAGEAEITITRRYIQQRLIPAFMEPRSVIVDNLIVRRVGLFGNAALTAR